MKEWSKELSDKLLGSSDITMLAATMKELGVARLSLEVTEDRVVLFMECPVVEEDGITLDLDEDEDSDDMPLTTDVKCPHESIRLGHCMRCGQKMLVS
jgi:hypothetical protein